MLVLSRNVGEGVRIGQDIEVVVQEVRGTQVKLSFKAPRSIGIYRDELEPMEGRKGRVSDTSR